LRPGSERDQKLEALLRSDAQETEGAWVLPDDHARIGIVGWSPID